MGRYLNFAIKNILNIDNVQNSEYNENIGILETIPINFGIVSNKKRGVPNEV